MYCLKNVFPNVGFADSYLSEGDVVRVQFTLPTAPISVGAMPWAPAQCRLLDMANKDALTRRVAAINAEIEANPYYLEQNCLTKAYDAAMDVLTTLYVSQADVDAAWRICRSPVGHQLTAVAEVPATCETAGVEAYWKCSVCGKLFSDARARPRRRWRSWLSPPPAMPMAPRCGSGTMISPLLPPLLAAMMLPM